MFLLILLNIFSDYFHNESYLVINQPNNLITISMSSNFYITNCYYININNNCIYVSTTNKVLLYLDLSLFLNCFSNSIGNALYFNSPNLGECIINKICGFNSSISNSHIENGGIFLSINIKNKGYIFYSSIINIKNQYQYHSISIINGYQIISNLNSSNNNVFFGSGIYCYGFQQNNLSFSTFKNNFGSSTISFRYSNGNSFVNYCNVINNSCSSYAIHYNGGAYTFIFYCFYLNNTGYLFTIVTFGSCLIKYSTIYHLLNSLTFGSNALIENTFQNSKSFQLYHFSTYSCYTDFIIQKIKSKKKLNINLKLLLLTF